MNSQPTAASGGKRPTLSLGLLKAIVVYALVAYPWVDAVVRRVPISVVGSFWDEGIFALGLLLLALRVRSGWSLRTSPLLRPMGLFFAVSVAILLADLRHLSIGLEGMRATFEYMVAVFLALNLIDDLQEARRYSYVLIGLGSLAALHGIYQYATNAPMPESWTSVTETLRTRAYSIVGSPNGLGDYLALLVPLALGWAGQERRRWVQLTLVAAAGVLGVGLLLTFSRGAWLALVGAIMVVALSFDRRLLAAALAAAVLLTVAVPPISQRLDQLFSSNYWERSMVYGGRLYRWNQAYEQMAHRPVMGAGLGQFGGAVAARRMGVMYTDNYYAKTLAESGLAGLAAFVALMAACGWLGFRTFRALRGRPEQALALGLWGALLVGIFHNGVENIFEIPFLNVYFWFLAGLLSRLPALAGAVPDSALVEAAPLQALPEAGKETLL